MIAVIIAGGSGTRLWPLSTPDYPKHLLSVNGQAKSLLQQTYERAVGVADTVYVLTEKGHAHHVKQQLPELSEAHLIIEPGRRGTANCMLAALVELQKNHDKDEPVFILWADHYIRDIKGFNHSIQLAASLTKKENRIVLIGIEPDYPAISFGYIQKGALFDDANFSFNVKSFKEKPDYTTAKKYLKTGEYLWNCGYFIGSINTFEQAMNRHAPELCENYRALQVEDNSQTAYLSLTSQNIDNALIEKVDDLLVVPASFYWIDLGSYGDLHKVVDQDSDGNYAKGNKIELESVENSYIHNQEDKPVVVIGLDNVVVVNTKDGILVTRKDVAQKVGEVSKKLQEGE